MRRNSEKAGSVALLGTGIVALLVGIGTLATTHSTRADPAKLGWWCPGVASNATIA